MADDAADPHLRHDPLPPNADALLAGLLRDGKLSVEQAAIVARSKLDKPQRRWLDGLIKRAAELAAGR
jgi:hypothetical protein